MLARDCAQPATEVAPPLAKPALAGSSGGELLDVELREVDLARVLKPQLTVLDATRALLSNGPALPARRMCLASAGVICLELKRARVRP
jgi:hypothetical protein